MRYRIKSGMLIGVSLLGMALAGCGSQSVMSDVHAESAVESSRDAGGSERGNDPQTSAYEEDAQAEVVLNEKAVLEAAGPAGKLDGEPALESQSNIDSGKEEQPSDGAVIRVENPSWDYYNAKGIASEAPGTAALTLVKLTEQPNQITDTDEWFERNQLSRDMLKADNVEEGKERYSCEILSGPERWEAYRILVTDAETGNSYTLDFEDYRLAGDFKQKDAGFVEQKIDYAQVKDGILYLSIGHNTYAESSPHNAYVAAVDLSNQKVIWKTRPLVSNADNFVIAGDILLCGYGFTAELDYLYQLDLATGQILAQLPIKSQADYLILKDQVLYVRTYNTDYTFRVQ